MSAFVPSLEVTCKWASSMTLTKANIAKRIADDCGFMQGEASEIIEKLLEIMKKRLIDGEDVMISGFGKWHIRSKRPRRGRNPKTGQYIVVDARRACHSLDSLRNRSQGKHQED